MPPVLFIAYRNAYVVRYTSKKCKHYTFQKWTVSYDSGKVYSISLCLFSVFIQKNCDVKKYVLSSVAAF